MTTYNSPQVVINELDQSAVASSAFGRPYLILGEASQGRDDKPILTTTKANFVKMFGFQQPSMPGTYGAMEYLSFGNQLYYKRVTSTKFVKIGTSVNVNFVSSSVVEIPVTNSSYLLNSAAQKPIVIYLKPIDNSRGLFKLYITGYAGTANQYTYVYDSYGVDFENTLSIGPSYPLTIASDVYVGHAEPAFSSNVLFPKTTATPATTTLTVNDAEANMATASWTSLDNTLRYVTAYTNPLGAFGPDASGVTVTVNSSEPGTDKVVYRVAYAYSIDGTFDNITAHSYLSQGINVGPVKENKSTVTFSNLPALPAGYNLWVIYRSSGNVTHYIDSTNTFVALGVSTTGSFTDAVSYTPTLLARKHPTSAITLGLNGVASSKYAHLVSIDALTGNASSEYIFDTFATNDTTGSLSNLNTIVGGSSSPLAVGDTLYAVVGVTASPVPDAGAYTSDSLTAPVKNGQYLVSTHINPSGTALWRIVGNAAVSQTTTQTPITGQYMYKLALGTKYYYYTLADFDRYAAVSKGRGTWGNGYQIYSSFNQNSSEYELLVYDSSGNALERWINMSESDLVQDVDTYSSYVKLSALPASTSTNLASFAVSSISNVPVQYYVSTLIGGYDGTFDVDYTDYIANISAANAAAKASVDPAYSDLLASAQAIESFDGTLPYDVLAIPGVSSVPALATVMDQVCTGRKFSVCVLDVPAGLSPNDAVNYRSADFGGIDSSYSALYYNYGKIYDSYNQVNVWLPPTIAALRALAVTDASEVPYAGAAGMRRGLVPEFLELENYPTLNDRDNLYSVQINPIAKISGTITVWGNKTMQKTASMLSYFSVRRLLASAELAVQNLALASEFNPNDALERRRLLLTINPVFDSIKTKRGLYAFRLSDATTAEDVAAVPSRAHFVIELQPVPDIEVQVYDVIVRSPAQPLASTTTF
jgi:hypothetical protein